MTFGSVTGEGTISSNGIMWGGLYGCTTSRRKGSFMAMHWVEAGMPDVELHSSALGGQYFYTLGQRAVLNSASSGPCSCGLRRGTFEVIVDDQSMHRNTVIYLDFHKLFADRYEAFRGCMGYMLVES